MKVDFKADWQGKKARIVTFDIEGADEENRILDVIGERTSFLRNTLPIGLQRTPLFGPRALRLPPMPAHGPAALVMPLGFSAALCDHGRIAIKPMTTEAEEGHDAHRSS